MAQFNYCTFIWMCHSRTLINKFNTIQEQALRIVYNDYKSNLKELLERDYSFTIHERNIQYLATEAYKVKNGISPVTMNDVFQFGEKCAYELRSGNHLQRANIQTVHFGSESIKTLGAKIWDLIPAEMKASKSLMIFKKEIGKELDCQELLLSPLQDLYWPSWFHELTFTFLPSPTTC